MPEMKLQEITRQIKRFIACKSSDCLTLENQFIEIKENIWDDSLVLIAELNVQLGQLFSIIDNREEILEPDRKFDNIADELSDILLNLLYLAHLEKIKYIDVSPLFRNNTAQKNIDSLKSLQNIIGKLSEAILEKKGYRFEKMHGNYPNLDIYIRTLVSYSFFVIFTYALENNIDMEKEFQSMINSAQNFVKKKKEEKTLRPILTKNNDNIWSTSSVIA